MSRDYPLLVFGNFVNELMLAVPAHRHTDALIAVSPRKVWLSQPGDVVLTPRAMSVPLRDYACRTLGFQPSDVTFVDAQTSDLVPLAVAVRRAGLVDRLRDLAADRPGLQMQAFAQDRPTIELAAEIGIPLEGYGPGGVPEPALDTVYRINTKPGFRSLAGELGIRIADGIACGTPEELRTALRKVLTDAGGAVVKVARGSNGYGLGFWSAADLPDLEAKVAAYLPTVAEQPPGWVVEERLDFTRIVTVEMEVDDSGPRVLHVGEMRTPNGAFSGQITPLVASSAASDELSDFGLTLGRHLHSAGYRGPFDIDGGITSDDVLYATESNVRKTGCTYLDFLVKRLLGDDRADKAVWAADSRVGGVEADFAAGLARVEAAGLAFEPEAGHGVVLTSDTLAFDGKWRYLVIGTSHGHVEEIESELAAVLKLS